MGNFKDSFKKVVYSEGGYVNDHDDSGGETYMGVTRVHHPKSEIWNIIDNYKSIYGTKNLTSRLKKDDRLTNLIEDIYKKDYWDKASLDKINSDSLAHQIFDHGVNAGVGTAIKLAYTLVGLPAKTVVTQVLIDKLNEYGLKK